MAAPGVEERPGPGLHVRAGNAMHRTRAGLLDGVAASVAAVGVRRTTMSAVATSAGVAKATVYNHFRTKDDVLAALVQAESERLLAEAARVAAQEGLAAALAGVVGGLRGCAALRTVARAEPALLAPLLTPYEGAAWAPVRAGASAVLAAAGRADDPALVEALLRWVLGHLVAPAPEEQARAQAEVLAAAAPAAPRHRRFPRRRLCPCRRLLRH